MSALKPRRLLTEARRLLRAVLSVDEVDAIFKVAVNNRYPFCALRCGVERGSNNSLGCKH